jgi:hypothetical protein
MALASLAFGLGRSHAHTSYVRAWENRTPYTPNTCYPELPKYNSLNLTEKEHRQPGISLLNLWTIQNQIQKSGTLCTSRTLLVYSVYDLWLSLFGSGSRLCRHHASALYVEGLGESNSLHRYRASPSPLARGAISQLASEPKAILFMLETEVPNLRATEVQHGILKDKDIKGDK